MESPSAFTLFLSRSSPTSKTISPRLYSIKHRGERKVYWLWRENVLGANISAKYYGRLGTFGKLGDSPLSPCIFCVQFSVINADIRGRKYHTCIWLHIACWQIFFFPRLICRNFFIVVREIGRERERENMTRQNIILSDGIKRNQARLRHGSPLYSI